MVPPPVVIPTVPPALPRGLSAYFENPDGIYSPEICSEAGIILTPEALASTVVTTGGKLSASSTRLQLGHSVVSAIAKNHQTPGTETSSYPYYFSDTAAGNTARATQFAQWNLTAGTGNTTADHLSRLNLLRTNPQIIAMLMVVSHWDPILKQYSAPILRVFGAPAIATFSNDQVDPTGIPSGMRIDELWDKHPEALSSLTAIHPMLVAGSGMTRGVASKSASQFFAAADPYLLPTAAEVTSFVNVATTPKVAAWYFPIGSNPPIGLAWKLHGLTTDSLMSSVTAMVTRGAAPFVDIIRQHKNQMDQWFTAVQANPVDYQVHAIP
jgi:hypothetical protein